MLRVFRFSSLKVVSSYLEKQANNNDTNYTRNHFHLINNRSKYHPFFDLLLFIALESPDWNVNSAIQFSLSFFEEKRRKMKGGLEGCEKGVDWKPRLRRNNTRLSRVLFVPFSARIPQKLSEGGDRKEWWMSVREVYCVPPTVYARHIRHIRCIAFIPE